MRLGITTVEMYIPTWCLSSLKWPSRPLLVMICIYCLKTNLRRAQRLFDGWWLPVGCIVLVVLFSCLKCAAYVMDKKFMKIIESKRSLSCKGYRETVKTVSTPPEQVSFACPLLFSCLTCEMKESILLIKSYICECSMMAYNHCRLTQPNQAHTDTLKYSVKVKNTSIYVFFKWSAFLNLHATCKLLQIQLNHIFETKTSEFNLCVLQCNSAKRSKQWKKCERTAWLMWNYLYLQFVATCISVLVYTYKLFYEIERKWLKRSM